MPISRGWRSRQPHTVRVCALIRAGGGVGKLLDYGAPDSANPAAARFEPVTIGELLDAGLDLTVETHAFARLAFVEGDPGRAAMLMGAAEGVGRRVGLRAWPTLRRGGIELVAQIHQALGPARFDELFNAGPRLNQREAIGAARDLRRADTRAS